MIIDDILRGYSFRMLFTMFIMLSLLSFLGMRCWVLQAQGGDEHNAAIRRQSIREVRLPPIRGRIISADGELYTDNRPAYDVYFHIHEMRTGSHGRRQCPNHVIKMSHSFRDWTICHIQEQINLAAETVGRPSLIDANWVGDNADLQRDKLATKIRKECNRMERDWKKKGNKGLPQLCREGATLMTRGTNQQLSRWLARREIWKHIFQYPTLPLKAFSDLSEDELARIHDRMPGIKGLEISTVYKRSYVARDVGSHLVGYVGKRQFKLYELNIMINQLLNGKEVERFDGTKRRYIGVHEYEEKLEKGWNQKKEWEEPLDVIYRFVESVNKLDKELNLFRSKLTDEAPELVRAQEVMVKRITQLDQNRLQAKHDPEDVAGYIHDLGSALEDVRGEFHELRRIYYYYPELEGKAGLEQVFDSELAGKVGFETIRVDSLGYTRRLIHREPAEPGKDIILTIDSRAQRIAQRLLEGKRGALVCVKVNTGAVVAMVSSPGYDLSRFNELYSSWATDNENKPLLNRALAAGWTPGSIVKPLVAAAILENGIAQYDTEHNCVGYLMVGNRKIHCHHRSGHGHLNVLQALEVSCNPYFMKMGIALGADRLTEMYEAAGLGRGSGIELKSRGFYGTLPSREGLQAKRRRRWTISDTAHVSIGQGFIALSPLQAAIYTAAIANGGYVYRPHLCRAIRNASGENAGKDAGKTIHVTRPEILDELPASPDTLRMVRAGMYKVVHGSAPSAPVCRTDQLTIAGKTGTAEMGSRTNRWNNTWFSSFAPFENPEYAVVVLVEHGKSGGKTAAPIVRAFYDKFLGLK